MNVKFTKLQGAGNDYLYIDAINDLPACLQDDTQFYKNLSVKISDRHFGVGSDGIIVILKPLDSDTNLNPTADFRMRMFNADGSEGEMCGNGIRCFAKYVYDHHLTDKKIIAVETLAGVKTIEVFLGGDTGVVDKAKVFMGSPVFKTVGIPAKFDKPEIVNEKITVGKTYFEVSSVSMGNPHTVVFIDDVMGFDVPYYGKMIEDNPIFPNRTNVEFVQIQDKNSVLVRTWERGSGETLACGTGACAVYSVMRKTGRLSKNSLNINLLGGTLHIEGKSAEKESNPKSEDKDKLKTKSNGDKDYSDETYSEEIYMTGPAEEVFTGYFNFGY